MKPFEHWKYEEVELTFGIERVEHHPVLSAWLEADETADEYEQTTLKRLHVQLARKVEAWNEDELKFFFIAEFVNLVNFSKPKVYSSFSQRTVSTTRENVNQNKVHLRGRIEFFVAMGEQIPRQPFFFLHEYKPLNKSTPSDPLGQLLIAMLATQSLNHVERPPMYGAYVRGSNWQFVVLDKEQYAVSMPYDALEEAKLFRIFSILKRCKGYIEAAVAAM